MLFAHMSRFISIVIKFFFSLTARGIFFYNAYSANGAACKTSIFSWLRHLRKRLAVLSGRGRLDMAKGEEGEAGWESAEDSPWERRVPELQPGVDGGCSFPHIFFAFFCPSARAFRS